MAMSFAYVRNKYSKLYSSVITLPLAISMVFRVYFSSLSSWASTVLRAESQFLASQSYSLVIIHHAPPFADDDPCQPEVRLLY